MVTKKAPVKKTTKKTPPKRPTSVKKKGTSKAKTAPMRSFRVYKPTESFTTIRFSRQTLYWTIILLVIMITQLWVLSIQLEIAELTNELVLSTSQMQ